MAEETWDKRLRAQARQLRDDVRRRASGERVLRHVPTGFTELDRTYGGLRMGVVTELLAHTGDGKSAFMRQCCEGGAQSGGAALWFVAEDPADATAERQISGDTGIDTTQIGRLELSTEDLDRIDQAVTQAGAWAKRVVPVFEPVDVDDVFKIIDETTTIAGAPLRSVYLDYAQLLGASRNLEDEIARLGEGLHQRSRDRGFATMLASQVDTECLKKGRDAWFQKRDVTQIRPSFGSTEWCKRLEKLCKCIMSLYRPHRWMREWGEDVVDNVAELHIIKANFGCTGWIELGWDGPTTRFLNR